MIRPLAPIEARPMPRPKSDLTRVLLTLSPPHLAALDTIAAAREIRTEAGEPNRSAVVRQLIEEAVRRLEKKTKKIPG